MRDREKELLLSKELKAICQKLEKKLARITGEERTPVLLLIKCADNVQYIANVRREDGKAMLVELLERWEAGLPDVPEHQKKF